MMDAPLLAIENLRTYFYSRAKRAFIRSVDGVSLHVAPGETLGIVGESAASSCTRIEYGATCSTAWSATCASKSRMGASWRWRRTTAAGAGAPRR